MTKRLVVVVAVLVAVGGAWWWRSASEQASTDDTTRRTGSASSARAQPTPGVDGRGMYPAGSAAEWQRGSIEGAADAGASGKPGERPSSRVVRMANPEAQRRELAKRIAAAIARRAAAPATDDRAAASMDNPEQVLTELQSALQQVRDYVSECVDRSDPTLRGFQAAMTLTGDPDVGTLIDATALSSLGGVPLPAALDDCVRSVMQSLELPPLAVGTAFKVSYELTFDD